MTTHLLMPFAGLERFDKVKAKTQDFKAWLEQARKCRNLSEVLSLGELLNAFNATKGAVQLLCDASLLSKVIEDLPGKWKASSLALGWWYNLRHSELTVDWSIVCSMNDNTKLRKGELDVALTQVAFFLGQQQVYAWVEKGERIFGRLVPTCLLTDILQSLAIGPIKLRSTDLTKSRYLARALIKLGNIFASGKLSEKFLKQCSGLELLSEVIVQFVGLYPIEMGDDLQFQLLNASRLIQEILQSENGCGGSILLNDSNLENWLYSVHAFSSTSPEITKPIRSGSERSNVPLNIQVSVKKKTDGCVLLKCTFLNNTPSRIAQVTTLQTNLKEI